MEENRRTTPAFAALNCSETPGSDALGLFPTYYCIKCEHGYFTELPESTFTHRSLECTNCGQLQDLPVNHIIHLVTTGGKLPESIDDFNKRLSDHLDKFRPEMAQRLAEKLTKAALTPKPTVGRIVHIFPGDRWQLPKGAKKVAAIVTFIAEDGLTIDCTAFMPTPLHKVIGDGPTTLGYVPHISMNHDPAEPCWDWPERS